MTTSGAALSDPRRARFPEEEWRVRVDLAAVFRLVAHYRMSDLAGGFAGARVPGDRPSFVLGAYGVFPEE